MTGAYPEIWIRGREGVGSRPLPPLHPLRFTSPPFPSPALHFPSPPLPLEVGPLIQLGVRRSAVSSPSGVWDGAPTEIEFGTF